jgi:hypothetical protein
MDTEVPVVRRAVEAKIDGERNRGPGGVILTTVKTGLRVANSQYGTSSDVSCFVASCSPCSPA